MINLRTVIPFSAALVALALAGCKSGGGSYWSGSTPGTRVAEVKGTARCADATRVWRAVHVGDTVVPGTLIQTATESAVDIVVDMGTGPATASRILVQSDSVVGVEGLPSVNPAAGEPAGKEILLEVRSGWLTFTSGSTNLNPLCEVRTSKGLAGSHGASFNVHANGSIRVFMGTVVMKTFDDQPAKTVGAGMLYDGGTGTIAPASTQPVEPEPTLTAPPGENPPSAVTPSTPTSPKNPTVPDFLRPIRPK